VDFRKARRVKPISFQCQGHPLIGVLHEGASDVGVVIVVGGPQTRVGSHRQFVKLAQALSAAGISTLRFDTRGMGDSHGDFPGFTGLTEDINAAVNAFLNAAPNVKRVILWGLCDGASAILIGHDQFGPQVRGFVLVNPWVHAPDVEGGGTSSVAAQVQVKHYYAKRIMSGDFWKKLLSGGMNPFRAAGEFAATAKKATASSSSPVSDVPFIEAMRQGWFKSTVPALVITAGDDLVAQEWLACGKTPAWAGARTAPTSTQHLAEANHTFSSQAWRAQVERWTVEWIEKTVR
jgi:uncharacterized protein